MFYRIYYFGFILIAIHTKIKGKSGIQYLFFFSSFRFCFDDFGLLHRFLVDFVARYFRALRVL